MRRESDYAKWMIEDPRINFAISTRGGAPGVDHLGIQTDSADELLALRSRAAAAGLVPYDQGETSCCYARSEKHWLTDPQGVPWEHFHTLGDVAVFGRRPAAAADATPACCAADAPHGARVAGAGEPARCG